MHDFRGSRGWGKEEAELSSLSVSRDQLQGVEATQLPRLIRQLVLETTPGLVEVDFPADQGVYSDGWDGIVRSAGSTPWVPDGLSLWEIAVRKSGAQRKANQDYGKGTLIPDGSPSESATYVALVVNAWNKRRDWEKDRNAERRWRRVRAFGLDDLHTWLEAAPVTRAWLAREMGYNPYGYRPVAQWWGAWASQTRPCLTHSVVLAGRADQAAGAEGAGTLLPLPERSRVPRQPAGTGKCAWEG